MTVVNRKRVDTGSCVSNLVSIIRSGDGDLEMKWMTVGKFLGQPSDFRTEGWAGVPNNCVMIISLVAAVLYV